VAGVAAAPADREGEVALPEAAGPGDREAALPAAADDALRDHRRGVVPGRVERGAGRVRHRAAVAAPAADALRGDRVGELAGGLHDAGVDERDAAAAAAGAAVAADREVDRRSAADPAGDAEAAAPAAAAEAGGEEALRAVPVGPNPGRVAEGDGPAVSAGAGEAAQREGDVAFSGDAAGHVEAAVPAPAAEAFRLDRGRVRALRHDVGRVD